MKENNIMELELFDFVEETVKQYDTNLPFYIETEKILKKCYEDITGDASDNIIDIYTRIKGRDSLKEKLLRNKYYLDFETGEDALNFMPDIIGITIECQFIRNEAQLYQKLFYYFDSSNDGFNACHFDKDNYLNLHMPQPQMQRNGFTIYRIDGYYMYQGKKVNYELQIKSLVHRFWSEIEHSVVYKNPDFVAYDHFMKTMLSTVRDNLDVVDRQLEIIYDEISNSSKKVQIGMDPSNFKVMIAASITELVNRKMKETIGLTTDFKYCSAILAQFIYINDFANNDNTKVKMVDYLEHLNLLAASEIDFRSPIFMDEEFKPEDKFTELLGQYWLDIMNVDFEWHVFFVMLFAIEPGSQMEDFMNFLKVIKNLLILPSWYQNRFIAFEENSTQAKAFYEEQLATCLIETKKINIVHEETLLRVMDAFRTCIEEDEKKYLDYESFISDIEMIEISFKRNIKKAITNK